jgi:hypothetical protein
LEKKMVAVEVRDTELELQKRIFANNDVLDKMLEKLQLKNDAALSRAMGVAPPVVSKMRHGRLPFGDLCIIRTHELTDWPIRTIKGWLGQTCMDSLVQAKEAA